MRHLMNLLILAGCSLVPTTGLTQITRVEIDWEVLLLEPDQVAVAPQISLIMANRTSLTGDFAEFRINPEYDGYLGGVKIDTWRGPKELDESSYLSKPPLNQPNDKIEFTTVAEAEGGKTLYRMKDLNSQQWGEVANSALEGCRTEGSSSINFSLNLTMSESEIEYGHNMVSSIRVKEIRYYIDDDLARRDRNQYFLYSDGQRFIEPETDQEIIDNYIAF